MIKSAWIVPLLIKQLNRKDNLLCEEHRKFTALFGADRDTIVLLTPDGEINSAIRCGVDGAVEVAAEGMKVPDRVFVPEADDLTVETEEGTAVLLRAENTSVFGYVLLGKAKRGISAEDRGAQRIIRSFGNFIYHEFMGSIIQSVHEPVLKVRDLEVSYSDNAKAVNGVSFDICKGELTVLLGHSGSGKTSTVNVLGGMLKGAGGQVLFGDRDVLRMNKKELSEYRRDSVGFVFQNYNLIDNLTAGENIEIASKLVKDSMSADEALALVRLDHYKNKYPGEMSGGEKQRVSIARALAKKSKLLICDEPTGALDSTNANHLISLLQKLAKDTGTPVITITHNPEYSVLADHYLYMSDGSITKDYWQPFPLRAAQLKTAAE